MHIPLKVTTDYTLLKSLIKMSDLISFLCDNKINACGICDENLYGVLDFYFSCKKNNIKPIIGLSIKLNNLEVCLYAINYEGYKNLLKIHTLKEKNELNVLNIKEFCKNNEAFSEVLVNLETGRTHQIRVHMAYIWHPIVGDSLYGNESDLITRQALHAYKVEFIHPITSKKLEIQSELPADIQNLIS